MSKFQNQPRKNNRADDGPSKSKFGDSDLTNNSKKGDQTDGGPKNSMNETGYTESKFGLIKSKHVAPVYSSGLNKWGGPPKNPSGKPGPSASKWENKSSY